MPSIPPLTEAQFPAAVDQGALVVIDFWASWCGPCRQLAPVLEEISAERAGEVTIYKANIEDEPQLAARHTVMSVPTLVFYRNGRRVRTVSGGRTKDQVNDLINEELAS